MVPNMKATIKKAKSMVMERTHGMINHNTKVNGKIIKLMDLAYILGLMEEYFLDIFIKPLEI